MSSFCALILVRPLAILPYSFCCYLTHSHNSKLDEQLITFLLVHASLMWPLINLMTLSMNCGNVFS